MTTGAGLRIGSLFSGIGGLELGLEWSGVGQTVWQCEINSWCRNILQRHWPEARRYEDVRSLCIENQPAPVDVICAGFPCQDISVAGQQAGLAGQKSGLFYEIIRVLRILRPRYIVLENVANITAMPGVIGAVLSELHQSGYNGEWSIVSAAQVGAPHLRRRWFFIGWQSSKVANTHHEGKTNIRGITKHKKSISERYCDCQSSTSIDRDRHFRRIHRRDKNSTGINSNWPPAVNKMHMWKQVPVDYQPAICRSVNGVSEWLGNINRVEVLRALGNAVVPQCAEVIGQRLLEIYYGQTHAIESS